MAADDVSEQEYAESRQHNRRIIRDFFRHFSRDWTAFRALWVDAPTVVIPFAPPGMGTLFNGEDFNSFWRPVFEMQGKFDWQIEHEIVSANSDEIVIQSRSDVDVTSGATKIAYAAQYIQIFAFSDGKISKFTEYVDSYFMGRKYGLL